jgi:chromosome segregation ATPase
MTPENAHMHPELFLCDECVKRYFLSASIPIQPEPNELGKARTEIDDLKHQFNCLEKEWSKRGADLEASRTQVRHWREESGKLHAKLKASRVPELEKALAFEKRSHEEAREECNKLERQRDEARSAATRAQMAESRLRNEMTAAFGAHGLAAGPEAINGLVREREELKKRNDTQKTLIENFQNTVEVLNKDKAAQANAIQQLQDKFGALVNERNRLIHEVSILEAKDTEMVSKHAELLKISDQIDLRTEALVTERDTALKDRDEKVRALVTERDRANRGREELVERNRELGRQASSAAVFIRDLENALADLLKTSPELRPAD